MEARGSANGFTPGFFDALDKESGNLCFSGSSIRTALGMAALGARTETLAEFVDVLGIDADPSKNAADAKDEAARWRNAARAAELTVANRLWVEADYPLVQAFVRQSQDGYGAPATPLDFAGAPEASRDQINRWVSQATKGKISDLLPGGAIEPVTRLVLTNAVYFKGFWATPFDPFDTSAARFHTPDGPKNVQMMNLTDSMGYGRDGANQLVELPYRDSDLAMLIVLGDAAAATSGPALPSQGVFETWRKALATQPVMLSLPCFTISWKGSVKPELRAMGLNRAFDPDTADLSGISSSKGRLFVSDVFHSASVTVDETGTEAVAATGVTIRVTSKRVADIVVNVDHPFLFFLVNRKTGDILFAGRVTDPPEIV